MSQQNKTQTNLQSSDTSITGNRIASNRIVLGVEYNGSLFCGYQLQSQGTRTVQGELEKALSTVADAPIRITCAGRTDTGVHATGQVVHFDAPVQRPLKAWMLGSNTNLPPDVAVHWVRQVSDDFSARFSAVSRSYRYILFNRRVRSAVFAQNIAWSYASFDEHAMNTAAQYLLGEQDFSAFRSSRCQASHANRSMQAISIKRTGDYLILDIKANAFLHHMVRNIMGTLMVIGRGEKPVEWMLELLRGKDRKCAGMTASPAGLYLVNVEYPKHYGLPDSGWLPNLS
jgi:tRNA pseudouridine38-40 synthase